MGTVVSHEKILHQCLSTVKRYYHNKVIVSVGLGDCRARKVSRRLRTA